jgi:hypothetical protein
MGGAAGVEAEEEPQRQEEAALVMYYEYAYVLWALRWCIEHMFLGRAFTAKEQEEWRKCHRILQSGEKDIS